MDKKALKRCITYAMIGDAVGFLVEAKDKTQVERLCHILKDHSTEDKTPQLNTFDIDDWITGEKYTPGQISDDSQSTITLIEALLENPQHPFKTFAEKMADHFKNGRIVGYGHTSKNAIDTFIQTNNWQTCGVEDRLTNGAVMRVAPLGILFEHDETALIHACIQQSKVTHTNPLCILSAVIMAVTARQIYQKQCDTSSLLKAYQKALKHYKSLEPTPEEPFDYMQKFINQLQKPQTLDDARSFILEEDKHASPLHNTYGISTHSVICAFWSIYSFLLNKDKKLEDLLADCISIGGDTDTVASMACALYGIHQEDSHPLQHWLHDKTKPIQLPV